MAKRKSGDEQAFMDEILAHPDDDAPRLIYADWLIERNDPRGNFIQIQCEAHDLPDNSRRRLLRKQARELLRVHQNEWLAEVPKVISAPVFERGFLHGGRITPYRYAKSAPRIHASQPFQAPVFRGGSRPARCILETPHYEKLRSVEFDAIFPSLQDINRFANSPGVANWLRFRWQQSNEGEEALGIMGKSPYFQSLKYLEFFAFLGAGNAFLAMASSAFPNMEVLILSACMVSTEAIAAICAHSCYANLRELDLSYNLVTLEGVLAITSRATKIEALSLVRPNTNTFTTEIGRVLVESPNLPALQALDLSQCSHDAIYCNQLLQHLAATPASNKLRKLVFRHNGATSDGLIALCESPYLHPDFRVDMRGCRIRRNEVDALRAKYGSLRGFNKGQASR